jgi:two-component system, chemotaxis family, sensor kinase CheA
VVPLAGVIRCLDLAAASQASGRDGVMNHQGQAVPFVRLRSAFGLAGGPSDTEVLLIALHNGEQIGIVADQLLGKAQVVARPLGRFFSGLPAISGLTILGDGRVAAIVNINGLLEWSRDAAAISLLGFGPHGSSTVSAHA